MENKGKTKISRRTALKSWTGSSHYSCRNLSEDEKKDPAQIVPDLSNIPTDKMTYTTLSDRRQNIARVCTMRYPTVERETPEA